jgi:tetratricopeptide (TPR) repeat protein
MKKITLFITILLLSFNAIGQSATHDLTKAKKAYQVGKYDEALIFCNAVLKKESDNIEAIKLKDSIKQCQSLTQKIDSLINKENCEEAEKEYEKLLKINQNAIKQKAKIGDCKKQKKILGHEKINQPKEQPSKTENNINTHTTIDDHSKIITQSENGIIVEGDLHIHPSPLNHSVVATDSGVKKTIQDNYAYLPFGIKQFTDKQTGKGILFASTEPGLLMSGAILISKANRTYKEYLKKEGIERNMRKKDYDRQFNWSMGCFAVAGAMFLLNYCDNFNWFRHSNDTGFKMTPAPTFDWQGKPQISMTVNINF